MIPKKKKVPKGTHDTATRIKVQLDHKTTMIVHSMQAFKMWKKRYPLARVIAWTESFPISLLSLLPHINLQQKADFFTHVLRQV